MNPSRPHPPCRPPGLDPALLGTTCCVLSALSYTAANICLRKLAVLEADEMWVTCMKEVVTVAVIGPWILLRACRGHPVLPPPRLLVALILTGLAVQLAGNLSVQWALGVVGLAITLSAIFGVMLAAAALFGFVFLGERVAPRALAAIALLILAVVLLELGAGIANGTTADSQGQAAGSLWIALGVAAACLAGLMFATLSTVIRKTVSARVPITTIVFVITGMGVLSLGSLSLWRLGPKTLLHTDPQQMAWMLAAGTFNLVAFLAITKGLQLTTVVHANVLNASQVAMGAVAGIILFHESLNQWMILGVCLTVVGAILIGRPPDDP
ncbi:MAG: DMT family transporter [Planctomycetes bacterium]|nr:DMT family transporter [Planctomycetota bacterium]